ncbi:hypothetical protein nbrc107696_36110 [Gordonia spumicola]|uniref:Lysoplasmalogenase n=1 Tax=Gordonia spumicola TaxID=589161 RepID=A0A7I9VCT4_9ACTN|nr:lysoplasmalogenase [Gordonia spumicola]GEE03165.1 hypothetical protein nbrc107696_36110 [Gordonia spumicola]
MIVKVRDIALWGPYIVISLVHVGALIVQSPVTGPTKILLMPLLAVPVVGAWREIPLRSAVVLVSAVVLSWFGDAAGVVVPDGPVLPLMLGFFGAAHIVYIVQFTRGPTERRLPTWALVYVVWWAAMVAVIGPHAGAMFIGVAVYGIVLAGTAVTASRCNDIIAFGAAFFLTSDSLLAFMLFLPDAAPGWFDPLVMATYTIGQGLIVLGVLEALRPGDSSSR